MKDTISALQQKMEAAAAALDFEAAQRYRDRISLMRGGASSGEAERTDTTRLICQRPGAMGLGTNQQRIAPPEDWQPPVKPDPMTSGRATRRKARK